MILDRKHADLEDYSIQNFGNLQMAQPVGKHHLLIHVALTLTDKHFFFHYIEKLTMPEVI